MDLGLSAYILVFMIQCLGLSVETVEFLGSRLQCLGLKVEGEVIHVRCAALSCEWFRVQGYLAHKT